MSEIRWRRIHPATIFVEIVERVKGLIVPIIFVVFLSQRDRGAFLEIFIGVVSLLGVVGAVLRYFFSRFAVHDGNLLINSGVIFKKSRTIPVDRIQNINMQRSLLHRLFGIVDLNIETAAGVMDTEAKLSALSEADAEALKLELAQAPGVQPFEVPEDTPAPPPVMDVPIYHASTKELFIAGATENRAGAIIGAIIGVFFTFGEGPTRIIDRLEPYIGFLPKGQAAWLVGIIGFLFFLLIGWIASIVMAQINYHNFKLFARGDRLHRSYGLFTHFESVIPTKRVQLVKIGQTVLQRALGVGKLYVDTAGSFSEKDMGGTALLTPLSEEHQLTRLCDHILPGSDLADVEWERPHPAAKWRMFANSVLWWAFVVTALAVFYERQIFWLLIGVPFLSFLIASRRYANLGYAARPGFLYTRSGVLSRYRVVMPRGKLQTVTLTRGPLQQSLGIASVQVSTAAMRSGQIAIEDIPYERALELTRDLGASPELMLAWDGV